MAHSPDLLDLPGHVIRRLQQQSAAVFQDRTKAAGFDVTSVQFAALSTLATAPGLDQASLAKRIAYDRATIGGVVKRLEQKGWVVRMPDDADRRAFKVILTAEGTAAITEMTPIVHALQNEIMGGLSQEDQGILLGLMKRALKTD